MLSSVTSVSPVSSKLGLPPVSHTLNTDDLVLGISIVIYCSTVPRNWGFLMQLLCDGPSIQKCHRHVKIVDMSDERTDQSMRTTLFLLILMRYVLALSS